MLLLFSYPIKSLRTASFARLDILLRRGDLRMPLLSLNAASLSFKGVSPIERLLVGVFYSPVFDYSN